MLSRLPLRSLTASAIAAAAIAATALPASAHVSIVTYGTTFTAGKTNVFFFRVPHGCPDDLTTYDFNARTTKVEVTIDAGATSVKPQMKPGWTVAVDRDPTTKAALKVTWTAATDADALPDWTFSDFGIRATLNGVAGDKLLFPTTQYCGLHDDGTAATGLQEDWVGADTPSLTLVSATNKVENAADLGDLKSRVVALETSVAGALTSIANLVTADANLADDISALDFQLTGLHNEVDANALLLRQGFTTLTRAANGSAKVIVDLPTTLANKKATLRVGDTVVTTFTVNSLGDASVNLKAALAAQVPAAARYQIVVGATVAAEGIAGA